MAEVIAITATVIAAISEHSGSFIAKYSKLTTIFLNYCLPTVVVIVIVIIDSDSFFNYFISAEAIVDGNC